MISRNQMQRTIRSISTKYRSNVQRSVILSHRHDVKFSTDSHADLQQNGALHQNNLLQFDTLHELHVNASAAFSNNPLFGTYTETDGQDPSYQWMQYDEFGDKVTACRAVLKDLGVKEFAKVGIISNNRWEWAAIACAAYSLNAVIVPLYEAQLPSDWTFISNDAECSVLFCATQDIYDRVNAEVLPQTPSVKSVLCLDAPLGEPYAFASHMEAAVKDDKDARIIEPSSDDLADLIYTSGTTGKPKGVELLHSNIVSQIHSIRASQKIEDLVGLDDCSLSFLPWAHSYGQTCELWMAKAHGCRMGICRGVPHILEDLQMVKPTLLFSVPTLHKKVYDGVNNLIESSSPVRKSLMKTALAMGRKKAIEKQGGASMSLVDRLKHNVLDRIVLSKIRGRFGGNMKQGYVGGAALPAEVCNFLDDIGIPVVEGYGLTETSPMIAVNPLEQRKAGSVGKPLEGVNVVIMGSNGAPVGPGEEGEICCYGPNVMRGYHNRPEETEAVFSLAPDGKSKLFHTGDLGRMDEDGFLKVTGRLKEQYKLENGKYVCPGPIEEAISLSRFITQVVLCGANRPHNVALIVPDWGAIRNELGVEEGVSEDELVNDERVKDLIHGDIEEQCKQLKKFEIPRDVAFVAPFTAANNMLTPKMSIRRHMVIRAYDDVIASLYDDNVSIESKEAVA